MTKALRLTITGPDLNQTQTFRTFPVRIGRDPTFECYLGFWFISRRHARLAFEGDDLILYDEESRHGVFIRGDERLLQATPLREIQGVFRIGELTFQATPIDEARSPSGAPDVAQPPHTLEAPAADGTRAFDPAGETTGSEKGATGSREGHAPTRTYSRAAVDPVAMVAEAMAHEGAEPRVRAATRTYARAEVDPKRIDADAAKSDAGNDPRSATPRTDFGAAVDPTSIDADALIGQAVATLLRQREQASQVMLDIFSRLEESARAAAIRRLVDRFPELLRTAQGARLASSYGIASVDPETARAAHAALDALTDRYAPGFGTLDTPQQVKAFGDRLGAALSCLFEGTASLLFVYDVEGKGATSRLQPAELAAMLLGTKEGTGLLRGAFVQMVSHHARFARQAVQGVRGLLDELAPNSFRSVGFGPFRASARWKAYSLRHADLAAPDERSLLRLFGKAFVRAYKGQTVDGASEDEDEEQPGVAWLTLALGLKPG